MVSGCWAGLARVAGWAELALRQVRLRFEGVRFDFLHSKKHMFYSKNENDLSKTRGFLIGRVKYHVFCDSDFLKSRHLSRRLILF